MVPKNKIYPRSGDRQTIYLKNVITAPNIEVGDYTIYNDFVNDPVDFQKDNVLYHYPINHDRLVVGKFCSIAMRPLCIPKLVAVVRNAVKMKTLDKVFLIPSYPEQGFVTRTIPELTWAVFPCVGAMPDALQDVNTKIFTEWLPALKEYEFAAGYCVEMYDDPTKYPKGTQDEKYYCEIWTPVKQK
ncbi:MAG: effector binding domain-containing protein [Lachnospiraceae bacterium]|nr:effector binding domain-containing protein [Lachnospiraceae bacterium]